MPLPGNSAPSNDPRLKPFLPDGDFLFEKTGVCEVAPRPHPLTLDLLRAAYADRGPVARTYAAHGIRYRDTEMLRIVGNELYVDREAELRSLLPAYSRIGRNGNAPALVRVSGAWTSLRNAVRLSSLRLPDPASASRRLREALEAVSASASVTASVAAFLEGYETVFETNLYAEKALSDLNAFAKRHGASVAAILSGPADAHASHLSPPKGLMGNGINLADESLFVAGRPLSQTADPEAWGKIPVALRARGEELAASVRTFGHFREAGRWLAVALIGNVRRALLAQATILSDLRLAYFASREEAERGTFDEPVLRTRRDNWQAWNRLLLPGRLTNLPSAEATRRTKGISSGIAEGTIVRLEGLDGSSPPLVLAVNDLTPDLVAHFDRIVGIVSTRGSLLSHCAIVARERGLPIVSGVDLDSFPSGTRIRVDGSAGDIDRVNE